MAGLSIILAAAACLAVMVSGTPQMYRNGPNFRHQVPYWQAGGGHPGNVQPFNNGPVFGGAIRGDFDPHPRYSFSYGVEDRTTGDSKRHDETRDGDRVEGRYTLTEPDGWRRLVQYRADPVTGFNAIVTRHPGHSLVSPQTAGVVPLPVVENRALHIQPSHYTPLYLQYPH